MFLMYGNISETSWVNKTLYKVFYCLYKQIFRRPTEIQFNMKVNEHMSWRLLSWKMPWKLEIENVNAIERIWLSDSRNFNFLITRCTEGKNINVLRRLQNSVYGSAWNFLKLIAWKLIP